MQYFEYHHRSEIGIEAIEKSYPGVFHGLSEESIRARYFLSRYFERVYGIVPELQKDTFGKPLPIGNLSDTPIYWSLSHTSDWIAFLVSDIPCGIDIAVCRERDPTLFGSHADSEYSLISKKDWDVFYILWTAKEAIIKKSAHRLDDMNLIHLVRSHDSELVFSFLGREISVTSLQFQDIFISFTVS